MTTVSLKNVLWRAGIQGKLLAHVMVWFGDGNVHRMNAYQSNSPAVMVEQLDLMQAVGIEGVIVTWQGAQKKFSHEASIELCMQCGERKMLFGILLDPAVVKPGPTKEQAMTTALADPGFLAMYKSSSYLPQKYLLDYSTGTDYSKVMLPNGAQVLMNQKGFAWPNAYDGDNAKSLQELRDVNGLSTMKLPAVCGGFLDAGFPQPKGVKPEHFTGTRDYRLWVWDETKNARAIDNQAGQFFQQTMATVQPASEYVCLVTWNDYDEGTTWEHFIAWLTGTNWDVVQGLTEVTNGTAAPAIPRTEQPRRTDAPTKFGRRRAG